MVQPYPGGGQSPEAGPQPPGSVVNAVRLMYAGAAVTVITLVLSLFTLGSLKTSIRDNNPKLTPSQVSTDATTLEIGLVIYLLIGIALWLLTARMSRAGRSWARMLGTVLFAVDTLLLLFSVVQTGAAGSLFSLLPWVIGLAAVVFLWRRDSSEFFAASRGQ